MDTICKFSIGQIIHHLLFDYHGVIIDIDANFQGKETWYREMAKSTPPRDKPWYHILVDQSNSVTYVAEKNLEEEPSPKPIKHPLINKYFRGFENGSYKVDLS